MSTKGRIKTRRLSSFLIYTVSAIWLLSGCAAKSSFNPASVSAGENSQNYTDTINDASIMPVSDRVSNDQSEIKRPEDRYIDSEPRILLEPARSDRDQILGIDFTMLDQGRSRLTVTATKEVAYDLDRKGKNELSLNIHDVSIPSIFLREIDTTHFQSALNMVKPSYSQEKNSVSLGLTLREMVPFHIKQTDTGLIMDFGPTSVKPPHMEIVPLDLTEVETRKLNARQPQTVQTRAAPREAAPAARPRSFTSEPMDFDFIDMDVTHLLRLMNEVSKENIIWDPAIKGQKVSMILKGVPWDQALELILKNNNLAKRYVGENIVWITTKQRMMQILAEEEAEERKMREQLEAERRMLQEERVRAEEDAPLVTEYLPVDFAKADDIRNHIVLSERGKMSIDNRTNTIIITDVEAGVESAKQTIKQFDTPVKQIMIEARIVDASDSFSRDLGLRWNTATDLSRVDGKGNEYGGSFSTNSPSGWIGNLGLNFARLTTSGRGTVTLDASLALAESKGTARTLSAPRVIAQEGTQSTIKSGETIYTDPTENVAQESRDAALTLTVRPTAISYNDFITLELNVTDNQNVTPNLDRTKEIQTTLIVRSGETIVIGGIIKESEGSTDGGIPVLKDVPGLGWLFKARRKTMERSEMLIFLTPTVLPSPVKSF